VIEVGGGDAGVDIPLDELRSVHRDGLARLLA
jgi:hypothetical protein